MYYNRPNYSDDVSTTSHLHYDSLLPSLLLSSLPLMIDRRRKVEKKGEKGEKNNKNSSLFSLVDFSSTSMRSSNNNITQ